MELIRISEAAKMCECSRQNIWEYINTGKLPKYNQYGVNLVNKQDIIQIRRRMVEKQIERRAR